MTTTCAPTAWLPRQAALPEPGATVHRFPECPCLWRKTGLTWFHHTILGGCTAHTEDDDESWED